MKETKLILSSLKEIAMRALLWKQKYMGIKKYA